MFQSTVVHWGITSVANHTYPNAGIKITSPGFSLTNAGTECVPNSNGFCLFSVNHATPATITVTGSGSLNVILCLNGAGPMSCQNYDNLPIVSNTKIAKTAYVTNYSGTPAVSLCTLNQSTGSVQNCQDAGGESVLSGIEPEGIILNNTGTIAYITNSVGTPFVYQCSVNANGTFNNCSAITISTPSGYNPLFGFIFLNSANTIAYIVDSHNNSSGRVIACPIVSGSLSGNCTDTRATNIGVQASGIVLNNTETIAYIGNYQPFTVTVCNVNGTTFSNCIAKTGGSGLTFNGPNGVALNNAGTILYIANSTDPNGTIYGCSTTANGGSTFNNCFIAKSGIADAYGITLNTANTLAYITDFDTNVYTCPINNNGTFGNCVMNSGFSGNPVDIVLGY